MKVVEHLIERRIRVGLRLSSGNFPARQSDQGALERRLMPKLRAQLPFAASSPYHWVLRILRLFEPDHCRGLIPISKVHEPVMLDPLSPAALKTPQIHRVLTL